jgi:folate-binding protein YgfZ
VIIVPTREESSIGYHAAIKSAALFDRSSSGKIEVRGPEAPEFLHNLCTNDVKNLPLGGGCEAFFCNERARALFHCRIYHMRLGGRDALWIDMTPGYAEALLKHLDRHLIAEQVELADRTMEFAQCHLAGPTASTVLAAAIGEPMPELQLHQHMERTIADTAVHIRRHDPLGVPGFDIVCLTNHAPQIRSQLISFGAIPADGTAWEWLRIEAGTPEYGKDIDDKRFVVEIGRDDAISFTKGCYLGQEPIVMARDRAGFVNRSFRGLKLSASAEGTAGAKLFAPDEVGIITSVTETPNCGAIGLAYLRRGFETPDTVVHVGTADGSIATVVELPNRTPAAQKNL